MTQAIASALIALVAVAGPRPAPTHAQTSQTSQTSLAAQAAPGWTFEHKKGEVLRYRTYIVVAARTPDDTGDVKLTVRSSSKNTTKDITADGLVIWEQLDDAGVEVKLNGMAVTSDEAPKPVTVTLAKSGLIVKRVNPAADPSDMSQKALPILSSWPVPPVGVKPGDTWKSELANPMLKNKFFTATSTLVGNESVLGIDCLKVQLTMSFPAVYGATEPEFLQHTATYWLDAKTRQLVRTSAVTKNPVFPFTLKNAEARAFVSRIVSGQNDTSDPEGEKLLK